MYNNDEAIGRKEIEAMQTIDKQNQLIEKLKAVHESDLKLLEVSNAKFDKVNTDLEDTRIKARTSKEAIEQKYNLEVIRNEELLHSNEEVSKTLSKTQEDLLALEKISEIEKNKNEQLLRTNKEDAEKIISLNKNVAELSTVNIELRKQNESLTVDITELKNNSLTNEDKQFYLGCKADVVLNKFYQDNLRKLSFEDLQNNAFPIEVLTLDESGIRTSNYVLEKNAEQLYILSKI
jgi:hypothetical protein